MLKYSSPMDARLGRLELVDSWDSRRLWEEVGGFEGVIEMLDVRRLLLVLVGDEGNMVQQVHILRVLCVCAQPWGDISESGPRFTRLPLPRSHLSHPEKLHLKPNTLIYRLLVMNQQRVSKFGSGSRSSTVEETSTYTLA